MPSAKIFPLSFKPRTLKDRKIEFAKAHGVAHHIDLDDLSAFYCKAKHPKQSPAKHQQQYAVITTRCGGRGILFPRLWYELR